MGTLSRLTRVRQLGQGMTEYIIIVALIAIAAIGVYSFFGQTTRQQTAQELPGKAPAKEIAGAQTSAGQPSAKPGDSGGAGDKKGAGVK